MYKGLSVALLLFMNTLPAWAGPGTVPGTVRAGPIGDGPWVITCGTVKCGKSWAFDYHKATAGNSAYWFEVYQKDGGFSFLSATTSWQVSVPFEAEGSESSPPSGTQRVKLTPSTSVAPFPLDPAKSLGSTVKVRAYHAPGHYMITAKQGDLVKMEGDLWIAFNGADFRTEFICVPLTDIYWPQSPSTDGGSDGIGWTIQWSDSSAFTGCAPGEVLYSYSVNLKPDG